MSNKSSIYICQNCGAETSQYFGRCLNCKEWNSIIEEKRDKKLKEIIINESNKSKFFYEIETHAVERIKTGFNEFDRVLGGGFVYGSVILLGGEPGIGKSTIILQVAASISNTTEVLYITAEESYEQVKIRWSRLNQKNSALKIFAENNLGQIIHEIKRNKPKLVIIDSIQAINHTELESSTGSVSQVRFCSAELQKLAKESNTAILIIGHVTKEGSLAGPKTLEHLVDVVLNFEGDQISAHRMLRSIKNRFGATLEIGIFEMLDQGLKEVKNPSASFTNRENIAGVSTAITNEGTRSFAVDIQALVNKSFYNNPRRTTTGINLNRLHQILAVIEKHLQFRLFDYDCYIATAGGFEINDPTSDLAVAISLISSLKNKMPLRNCSLIGEIGLSGKLRLSNRLKPKIEESIRLGFENILVPEISEDLLFDFNKSINIMRVSTLQEAIKIVLQI